MSHYIAIFTQLLFFVNAFSGHFCAVLSVPVYTDFSTKSISHIKENINQKVCLNGSNLKSTRSINNRAPERCSHSAVGGIASFFSPIL